MTTSTSTGTPTMTVARYGLARPEPDDVRRSLARISPVHADRLWAEVLDQAAAFTSGPATMRHLIDAMRLHPEPLVALAALGLEVRLNAFDALVDQELALHR